MTLYRQQKIMEALLRYRLRQYAFDRIQIEVYDRFDGDRFICRVELFKGGNDMRHRVLKHEAPLGDDFVAQLELKLAALALNP